MEKRVCLFLLVVIWTSGMAQEINRPERAPMLGMGVRPDIGRGPMIMDKQIIPTSDGGLIVSIGNKLIKYDKDLNLIREVTLPSPLEEPRLPAKPEPQEKR
ncbi:MAG: hypothetical protein NC911_05555 [Candidatus Omnitrophica bacterium]|nr:hypothetical protein [Candidatus Omnitrophota bacterium]